MSNPFTLKFQPATLDDLRRLDKPTANRILQKLEWLANRASDFPHQSLKGRWRGYYRLRSGDYRIIYQLDHNKSLIIVEKIGHRREVYDD